MHRSFLPIALAGSIASSTLGGTTAYVVDSNDGLHTLDLATIATAFIATIDQPFVYDLALSDGGRLFGMRDAEEPLFEIDPNTAQGTSGVDTSLTIRGIEFLGDTLVASREDERIVGVDPTDGSYTELLLSTQLGFWGRSMTVASESTLYLTQRGTLGSDLLYRVDLDTQEVELITLLGIAGNIRGIDYVNGSIFAATSDGGIYTIDTTSGESALLGNVGFSIDAFAAVPAPGTVSVLAGIAVLGRRRRT